ncbi:MAG: transmembrane 220 family protein [Bacteroidota bacterium]
MKILFKTISLVFALFFVWAAVVQHNDQDAMQWYAIYGMAALASVLFALGRLKLLWAILLCVFYMVFAIYSWPKKFEGVSIGEGNIVNIERGREALGLIIAGILMLVYAIGIKFSKKS